MQQGNVDVLKLRARGKATISLQAGTVSLKADDPVSALQAIAQQASIRIELTPQEVEQVRKIGKGAISLSYASNIPGATEAAKKIFDQVGQAQPENNTSVWKMIVFGGVIMIIGVLVFIFTYRMLEKAYG